MSHCSFKRMGTTLLILSTLILSLLFFAIPTIQAATVSNITATVTCADKRIDINITGNFQAGDAPQALVTDGNGAILIDLTSPFGSAGTSWGIIDFYTGTPANPMKIEIKENGNVLMSKSFTISCFGTATVTEPEPPSVCASSGSCGGGDTFDPRPPHEIDDEIIRLPGSDGDLVAHQHPNGTLEFWIPTQNCKVGELAASALTGIDISYRVSVSGFSTQNCGGYEVAIWSLGFPACALQANIYGSNGYEKVIPINNVYNTTCHSSDIAPLLPPYNMPDDTYADGLYHGLTEDEFIHEVGRYLQITKDDLRLRSEPNLNGEIIGRVKKGEYFHVLREQSDWALVETHLGAGWISSTCCSNTIDVREANSLERFVETFLDIKDLLEIGHITYEVGMLTIEGASGAYIVIVFPIVITLFVSEYLCDNGYIRCDTSVPVEP